MSRESAWQTQGAAPSFTLGSSPDLRGRVHPPRVTRPGRGSDSLSGELFFSFSLFSFLLSFLFFFFSFLFFLSLESHFCHVLGHGMIRIGVESESHFPGGLPG